MSEKMVRAVVLGGGHKMVPVDSLIHRVSAYAIFVDEGQVLLLPHKHAGTLGCPGGEVDKGETHQQAITRECREEIGTDQVDIGEVVGIAENIFFFDGNAYQTHMIYYHGWVDRSLVTDPGDEYEGPPMWYNMKDLKPDQFPELRVNDIYFIIGDAVKSRL